jgi:hypothetical protein
MEMTMISKTTLRLSIPATVLLAVLTACGGGGGGSNPAPTPKASSLAYTDPTSGTYLLKKDPASSGSHLVLDLVGPATGTASGVTLTLNADTTRVAWVDVPAGGTTNTLVQNGTQFNLGSATPYILLARTYGATTLMATAAQKGLAVAPASLNGVLLKVALDLKPNLGLAPGTNITLSADSTKSWLLDGTAKSGSALSPITVSVGALTAQ